MLSRWSWFSSAATKKRAPEHEFSSRAIVLALLVCGVAGVFWQQFVGAAVFIGESDRLNTYLNMRLAEYDALRTYGRVPAWNPSMFGGFSVAALHWMNPGTDPIAFFLQLFPRDRVYQALGYVSIALVLAACTTAYFYIRDLTGVRIPAAIAALCYGLSAFGIHRIAQVDNAYLTLVLLPAAMLAIRKIRAGNLMRPFAGLTLSMSALAFWGFLQEVAYVFCFLAAYALYRAAVSWRSGPREALGVLIIVATSFVVCLLFAAPRLITVGSEFFGVSRTPGQFHHPGYQEFLRFFHEGIYGRYFAEGLLVLNSLNLHEGLQLLSSTTVALFVRFGVLRPTTRLEFVAGLLLFAMIFAIGPIHHLPPAAPWPSKELIDIALFFCLLAFGAAFAKLLPATPRPPDTAFNLLALVVILFLILVPEAFYAVYLIFGRIDFSHTRLSILLLLPLCSLFAIYLAELKAMVQEALHAADELVRHGVQAEIIDLRSVRPLDEETILQSIRKTGHLVVADTSWELCGVASEIAALAAEKAFSHLKAPVLRIALANCPAPVSLELEQAFYPKASTIARAALATLGDDPDRVGDLAREDHFKGPY
jgi:hypothetical protein